VRAWVSIASFYTPTRVKMGDGIRRASVVTGALALIDIAR
jgi:hypothetical protein